MSCCSKKEREKTCKSRLSKATGAISIEREREERERARNREREREREREGGREGAGREGARDASAFVRRESKLTRSFHFRATIWRYPYPLSKRASSCINRLLC